MADLAQGIAITPQSIFHVASVSKQFTAMSLVLLARSGRISLDDEVHKYLPELPPYPQPITIRQLLQHTSGIRDQWNLLMTAGWRLGDDLITEQDVVDIVRRQKGLNFAPGTDWLYSNTGFSLAAVIVKRVTGKSLREYAGESLFGPLGMTRTHFHDDNQMVVPGRTRGYSRRGNEWRETVPNYSTVGATSLFTTVVDAVAWHRQLDEGTVGGAEALATLTTPAVLASGDTLGYALGISTGTYRGQRTLSHGGGDPGYRTHLLHFPGFKGGVTVFCNLNEANPQRLAEQTADLYFAGELSPVAALPDSASTGPLATATGLYWSDQSEGYGRAVVESGKLLWRTGPNATTLRRRPDGRYLIGSGPTTIEVLSNGDLRIVSGNGEPVRFTRVADWTPTAADFAAIVGRYASDEIGVTFTLRQAGDTVFLERPKFAAARLTPVFKDTYTAVSGLPFVIRAIRNKAGRVEAITVGSGRVRRMQFRRLPDRATE
jgi:CubicO group peptidase (beta-lactamase class C family)